LLPDFPPLPTTFCCLLEDLPAMGTFSLLPASSPSLCIVLHSDIPVRGWAAGAAMPCSTFWNRWYCWCIVVVPISVLLPHFTGDAILLLGTSTTFGVVSEPLLSIYHCS
jgi:hypothetical protein